MLKKILFILYLNNFFRLCVYSLKLISFFKKNYKDQIFFYNFFKKKNKKIDKSILEICYRPKIFILKFKNNRIKIIDRISRYENLNIKNEFSNHGHKKVFQSTHDLNDHKDFKSFAKKLENYINKYISSHLSFKKFNLVKMWFVITKNSGLIKKHSHLHSDFSGVYYLKVDQKQKKSSGIKIFNNLPPISIYEYDEKNKNFEVYETSKKIITIQPKLDTLIIFNSYLEHGVNNKESKIADRISLPFDLNFK